MKFKILKWVWILAVVSYLAWLSTFFNNANALVKNEDGSILLDNKEARTITQEFDELKKENEDQREIVRQLIKQLEIEKQKTCI